MIKFKSIIAAISVAAMVSLSGCAQFVQQGEVGLLIDNFSGKIVEVLEPGASFRMPVNQHVIEFPVIKQQYIMVNGESEGQDYGVDVNSLEGQAFKVEASVDYQLNHDKEAVVKLYQKYAMSWDRIVNTRYKSKFRSAIVKAFASLPMNEAMSGEGRNKVEQLVLAELRESLGEDGISVTEVMIRAVHPPEAIAESISAKTKAENDLIQARTVAQKKVAEAEGEAKAKMIRAEAEAKANKIIASSLTDELIRMRSIEKLNPNIQLVVPNSFINMGGLTLPTDKQ